MGDTVVVSHEDSKHHARVPHIVTNVDENTASVTKIINSSQYQPKQPNLSPYHRTIDKKFLTLKKKAPIISYNETIVPKPIRSNQTEWYPTISLGESDTDISSDEECLTSISKLTSSLEPIAVEGAPTRVSRSHSTACSDQLTNPQVSNDNIVNGLNQSRPVKKGDRVTFWNDLTLRWTIATVSSGPIKYYRKHGNYHNFKTDDGNTGGYYFNPRGQWSLLCDQHQELAVDDHHILTDPLLNGVDETSFYIDDDYPDQPNLSLSDDHTDIEIYTGTFHPSAASFPDLDVELPCPTPSRTRFLSSSDPELPHPDCQSSIRNRLRQWSSALRDAWASTSALDDYASSESQEGERKERKRAATPF